MSSRSPTPCASAGGCCARREYAEEQGDGHIGRQLLWSARLLREPERFKATLGEVAYAGELANCLWGIYQMIGKLSPVIYVLR